MLRETVRKNIIEIATAIFKKYGFKKTTMDDIAMAANKGKSSIYYYFKSKEEVYQAVVEKEAEDFLAILKDSIQENQTPVQNVRNYVETRMGQFMKFENLFEALKREYLANMVFITEFRKKYEETEIVTFKKVLEEGIAQKHFQIYDVNLAALAITTAMKGMEEPIFLNRNAEQVKSSIDDLINILLYGIVRR